MSFSISRERIRAILLDIEGTTTPIVFVHDVLFPFARAHADAYLRTHGFSDELRRTLARLRDEHAAESPGASGPPVWIDAAADTTRRSALAYVFWLMDRDRKSRGLKELQGLIWDEGYRSGHLQGTVFGDVPAALERWARAHLDVRIFSSGSVLAQQLLFRTVATGDLTPLLHGYFDTAVGPKTSPGSYRTIADAFAVPSANILFVSDVVAELDAARTAGLRTLLAIRPGNPPQSDHTHPSIRRFDDIVE